MHFILRKMSLFISFKCFLILDLYPLNLVDEHCKFRWVQSIILLEILKFCTLSGRLKFWINFHYEKKENCSCQLTALLQNNQSLDQTWKCFLDDFNKKKYLPVLYWRKIHFGRQIFVISTIRILQMMFVFNLLIFSIDSRFDSFPPIMMTDFKKNYLLKSSWRLVSSTIKCYLWNLRWKLLSPINSNNFDFSAKRRSTSFALKICKHIKNITFISLN